jgi:hypothetical protein
LGFHRAGGVAQVVEHLPRNNEALNSNPSTAKRKNKITEYLGFQMQTTMPHLLAKLGSHYLFAYASLISTSKVVRIISKSHCALLWAVTFESIF